ICHRYKTIIMKKIILILSILLSGTTIQAQNIEANKLAEKLKKQPLLIDVRTTEEYNEGTILGAMNLNLNSSDSFLKLTEHIEKDREIILFCQSGVRSNEAYEQLKSDGFKNVSQLEGGYERWLEQEEENSSK